MLGHQEGLIPVDTNRVPPIARHCERCNKLFRTWPYKVVAGEGRFCGKLCSNHRPEIEDVRSRFLRGFKAGDSRECWPWLKGRSSAGYGLFRSGRRSGVTMYAHRFAMATQLGVEYSDLPNLCVCHRCDNPPCVNPAHLFLGTHADNVSDMLAKSRHRSNPTPALGEQQPLSKLTNETVRYARLRAAAGDTHLEIAKTLNVSRSAVTLAVARKSWGHVA